MKPTWIAPLLFGLTLTACGGTTAEAPAASSPAPASAAASKPAPASAAAASVAAGASASAKPAASAAVSAQAAPASAQAKPAASAESKPAASGAAAKPQITLQMPAAPDPVAVKLNPATTALLLNDVVEQTCKPQPSCTGQMIPKIASLLTQARKAGVYVIYSTPAGGSPVLPEVAPAQGDPVVPGQGQDRFYNTNLDSLLKAKNVSTLMLGGWRINGSVVYTSVGATLRGYTVVVPDDITSAATDYDIAIGRYQILTQVSANANNEPLKPKASTLSRTDLITFQ
jgi:nicotinamidase-related amidase